MWKGLIELVLVGASVGFFISFIEEPIKTTKFLIRTLSKLRKMLEEYK